MKVRSILMAAACLLFISHYSAAQTPQVNNSGFENWDNLGAATEEPTDWNSFMSASGSYTSYAAQQIKRSTQKRPGTSGTYSAIIWSRDAGLGIIANGNMTTGQVNMGGMLPSSTSNYNSTITTNAAFYETLGASPDSLIVWVRFHPVTSTNQGRVHAILHGNYNVHDPIDAANSLPHVKAEATLNFASTGTTWVRKSIPFVYNTSTNTPDYILISFSTNPTAGGGSAGTTCDSLYVDDLSLFYNPVLTTGTINPLTYLVSSTMSASVSVPFTLTGSMNSGNIVTAQLSDATGSFVSPQNIGTLTATTSGTVPGTIPAGTATSSNYRIRVVSSSYPITAADNGTNITISDVTGIQNYQSANTSVYFSQSQLVVDLQQATYNKPIIQVYNMSGQIVGNFIVKNNSLNRIDVTIPAGIYMFRIMDGENSISGKIVKL